MAKYDGPKRKQKVTDKNGNKVTRTVGSNLSHSVTSNADARAAFNPRPAKTLSKAELCEVVRDVSEAEGVAVAFSVNDKLAKLGVDALITKAVHYESDVEVEFVETPGARQGEPRHPADAARLIKARHKVKGGSLTSVAEAWYAKSVYAFQLPGIAKVTSSAEGTDLVDELNSREGRERIVAAAAARGVRLGFGRPVEGPFGLDYELSDDPWVALETTPDTIERAYRAQIREHLG